MKSPPFFWDKTKDEIIWEPDEKPKWIKGGFTAKGSAGTIPFFLHHNEVYVLLSRENDGKDKNTYCDLGGAVEVVKNANGFLVAETFLSALLKETQEESGYLYSFSEEEIMQKAFICCYEHDTTNKYNGFETVIAFVQVDKVYFTEDFLEASKKQANESKEKHLPYWVFQEKDDYQWVNLKSLINFLKNTDNRRMNTTNILNEKIEILFRPHFLEALKTDQAILILESLLTEKLLQKY
ncbi:MAG: hypothetical protein Tsb0021_17400 [Chlamydiales bacterium]